MKFSQYLMLQENQSQPISEKDAIRFITTKCRHAYEANINMYRGVPTQDEYMIGDAAFDIPRKSANTTNYTTLILDNLPEWKKYPKRSKSYICSTDPMYASEYGSVFQVFPVDGANIGICPRSDIWYSFRKLKEFAMDDLHTFNWALQNIFYYHYNRTKRNDTTFENIKQGCMDVDEYLKSINYNYKLLPPYELESRERKCLMKLTADKTPMLEGIAKYLSPVTNDFQHSTINQISKLPKMREVWTDAACIFKRISI